MSEPVWRQFEKAVAAFLAALDPTARVKHDVSIPDVDTGTPRQRDVWIEAKLLGHFPVTVYVSCKDVERPLSQQSLDAVIGELRSSGANIGVVYSTGGFTENALAKAKNVGIHCCQLFIDQPPTLPEHLALPTYLCVPDPQFALGKGDPERTLGVRTYEELLAFNENSPDGRSLLAHLNEMFFETIREVDSEMRHSHKLPESGIARLITLNSPATGELIEIYTAFNFEFYEGKLEYYLLNGSYCLSNGEFVGSQWVPRILLGDDYPGPHWTLVDRAVVNAQKNYLCLMLYAHDYSGRLEEALKGPIPKCAIDNS